MFTQRDFPMFRSIIEGRLKQTSSGCKGFSAARTWPGIGENPLIYSSQRVLVVLILIVLSTAFVGDLLAADFRVENRVFFGKEKELVSKSTTIFCGGVVYDFLDDPEEIIIFDKARDRFLLLDVARSVKTELTTDEVRRFMARLKSWALQHSEPVLKFMGDPKFDKKLDEASSELTFSSQWMTYRLTEIDAESEDIADQYHEFCDWHAKLNTLLSPGGRLPFARMVINKELHQRQQLPDKVELTLRLKSGMTPTKVKMYSEHLLVRRLVESDRRRVANAGQFMATFDSVSFAEYQKKIPAK